MLSLIVGMVVFFGIHLLPAFVSLRQRAVAQVGELTYKGLFSLIALGGFALIINGTATAPWIPIWEPPVWGRQVAITLMPLAFIMIASAYLPSNMRRYIRHPMLWGVSLWAIVHLISNEDLASIMLFGSFLGYSLFDMWSANRRGRVRPATSYALRQDSLVVLVGMGAYVSLVLLHPYLFGVAVMVQ